jgi:hypothetical protein
MASYANFLGRHVTISYRVSDILLPASGKFVGDSGRSIFLEQHLEQRGRMNYFRWEIPYQHIYKITDATEQEATASADESASSDAIADGSPAHSAAHAASASASGSPLLPHRPKTA